jgi:hypothetical protein
MRHGRRLPRARNFEVSQIRYRNTEGRAYYQKKISEGMTGKSALRALNARSATRSTRG